MALSAELQNAQHALEQKRRVLQAAQVIERLAKQRRMSAETSVRLAEHQVQGLEMAIRGPVPMASDSGVA